MSNKRLHLRVWSHAIKQGSNLLLGELGNMVRELEALRKSTDEPQGKLFTYRAQAIFRNHGCEYPFKPTGQSEAEFRAEKQAARTAMSHLDEPTDN